MDEWLQSAKYLPAFMRDFHDQKAVFKRIQEMIGRRRAKDGMHTDILPGWISAHIYVVDFFLWYMARCGWTLQRSRANLEFNDIGTDLEAWRERDMQAMFAAFKKEEPRDA